MRVDKFTLALMNRRLVLKTIWERGAINKAEIARRTGLSLPTAIKITDELLDNRRPVLRGRYRRYRWPYRRG